MQPLGDNKTDSTKLISILALYLEIRNDFWTINAEWLSYPCAWDWCHVVESSIHFKTYTYYILPLAEGESKAESSVKFYVLTKLIYRLNCHLMYKMNHVSSKYGKNEG